MPVGIASDDIVSDALMLIGDGARQADPLTGGGIANAMIAAQLAAEVAVDAVERSDTSRDSLKEYQSRWTKGRGRKMARNYRLKSRFPAAKRTSPGFLRAFALATAGK